jgi:hypothetical protein
MSYGNENYGNDIYGGGVAVPVRIAFGTLDAWTLLTPTQRAYFDGGNYLTLKAAIDNHPGASATNDHYYQGISETDNALSTFTPIDTNGFDIIINGGGFTYNYTGVSYCIQDNTENANVTIYNTHFKKVNDGGTFDSFIRLNINTQSGDRHYYKNCFDMDNFIYNAMLIDEHGSGSVNIYENEFKNSSASSSFGGIRFDTAGGLTGTYNCENNTFYNIKRAFVDLATTNYYSKNNNAQCTGACFSVTTNDLGGNASSDATGSVGYQNIIPTDAMEDPVGGDYRPKIGGPLEVLYSAPLIPENTAYYKGGPINEFNSYSGAYGRSENFAKFGGGSINKLWIGLGL